MDNKPLIYVADDDESLLNLLSDCLEREGNHVLVFTNGDSLLTACTETLPDLVVLDIMMPGMDGLSVCSELRKLYPELLIIIISARVDSYDRVTGLSIGCDEYIIKPFLPLELTLRVRALMKRRFSDTVAQSGSPDFEEMRFGSLVLYPGPRTAMLYDAAFSLSPTEFDFLALLISKNGAAASREELLVSIWQVNWKANTRVADDLVKRLRRKFRNAGSNIRIDTVWGYGFRLSLNEASA